jgi:hypothetical protein
MSKTESSTQSAKPQRQPKADNHAKNVDMDELAQLLAEVPAERLPQLLSDVQRIAKDAGGA